jgi:hypothetical protein
MNRFRSGLVPLFALLAVVGCSSEPTEDLRGGIDHLEASPTQLFLEVGQTKTVQVGAVDAQGNPLDFNYEVTATGPGITVRRDSSFLPIFVNDSTLQAPATGPRFRFIVEGAAYNASSFTVSAGGQEIVIPVQVIPQAGLAATFDDDTVDLGQVVALTAPAGITFTEDAFLTIGTDTLTIVSQDASTITFIPPPSVNSPVTINGVLSASTPDTINPIVYSPATQTPLVTPLIDTVDVTYSTVAPTLGQTVTLTSPNPLIQLVVDSIVFPGQLPGREGDPQNIVVAPDSNSLTFQAPPNIAGNGTVVNFHFPGDYLRALPTRPVVTGQSIGLTLPAGTSNAAPGVAEPVTLTAPAGFHFDTSLDTTFSEVGDTVLGIASHLAVALAGNPTYITDIAADGSTLEFVPIPGSIGIPQVDGVVPDASPSNILTMPTDTELRVDSLIPVAPGTDDPATAPSLPVPPPGEATVFFDLPDFETTLDRIYRIDITQAGTYTITMDWNIGDDVDMFVCPTEEFLFDADSLDPDLSTGTSLCSFQAATGAHPEVGTFDLTPGDYFIWADDFGQAVDAVPAIGTRLAIVVANGDVFPASLSALRVAPSSMRKAPLSAARLQRVLDLAGAKK